MAQNTNQTQENRPAAEKQTEAERLEILMVRNKAVTDFNRKAFLQMVLAGAVFVSIVLVTNYLHGQVARPLNVPVDNEMRYIAPLKKTVHNKSDSELATYAANTMAKMFSFDWYNVTFQLNQQVGSFTQEGWLGFKDNLERSEILSIVQDNRYILSFQLTNTPVVINKGVEKVNGEDVAFWTGKMNAKLLYINSATGGINRTDKTEITVRVVRVSTMESESGIAIQQTLLKLH